MCRSLDTHVQALCARLPGITLLAVSLAACNADGTAPPKPPPSEPSGLATPTGSLPLRDPEMMELAAVIQGFGGYYFSYPSASSRRRPDHRGPVVVHVHLTSSAKANRARATVRKHFHRKGYRVKAVEVVAARYTFAQLQQWRDLAGTALRGRGLGKIGIAASGRLNRVRVGFETAAARAAAEQILDAAGVPREAVRGEIIGRIVSAQAQDTLLRHRFVPGPLPGGVSINTGTGIDRVNCTIGFNVVRDGGRRFVSASHCSGDPFSPGADTFAVRHPADGNNIIAREYIDRELTPAGCPWAGFNCRYSDAAMFTYQANDALGRVAMPYYGTDTLVPGGRFEVLGSATTYNPGEAIDKVGVFGGWRFGYIEEPCWDYFDYWDDPPADLICQILASVEVQGGDSGGPVFFWQQDNSIFLAGIIAGRDTVSRQGVFSRFDRISLPRELGDANGSLGSVR